MRKHLLFLLAASLISVALLCCSKGFEGKKSAPTPVAEKSSRHLTISLGSEAIIAVRGQENINLRFSRASKNSVWVRVFWDEQMCPVEVGRSFTIGDINPVEFRIDSIGAKDVTVSVFEGRK